MKGAPYRVEYYEQRGGMSAHRAPSEWRVLDEKGRRVAGCEQEYDARLIARALWTYTTAYRVEPLEELRELQRS